MSREQINDNPGARSTENYENEHGAESRSKKNNEKGAVSTKNEKATGKSLKGSEGWKIDKSREHRAKI